MEDDLSQTDRATGAILPRMGGDPRRPRWSRSERSERRRPVRSSHEHLGDSTCKPAISIDDFDFLSKTPGSATGLTEPTRPCGK